MTARPHRAALLIAALLLAVASGCGPQPGDPGFDQARYEQARADRARYMYQGL